MAGHSDEYNKAHVAAGVLGSSLHVDETVRVDCPACGRVQTFTITRRHDGIVFNCYSVHCGVSGATHAVSREQRVAKAPPPPKEYTGPIVPLSAAEENYFLSRFSLLPPIHGIESTGDRFILNIMSPRGHKRGMVIRNGWTDLPGHDPYPYTRTSHPKAITYRLDDGPLISWHGRQHNHGEAVVIVEDIISAKVASESLSCRAIALCGSHLSNDAVAEIQKYAHDVIIALDPDATKAAFEMAKQWGPAFTRMRVAVLRRDIKDDIEDGEGLALLAAMLDA